MAQALLFILCAGSQAASLYTIGQTTLRRGPAAAQPAATRLDHNETLKLLREHGRWLEVETASGTRGYVPRSRTSRTWVAVHKAERRVLLFEDGRLAKTYRAALAPNATHKDKQRRGDRATPEGRFYITKLTRNPIANVMDRVLCD